MKLSEITYDYIMDQAHRLYETYYSFDFSIHDANAPFTTKWILGRKVVDTLLMEFGLDLNPNRNAIPFRFMDIPVEVDERNVYVIRLIKEVDPIDVRIKKLNERANELMGMMLEKEKENGKEENGQNDGDK